MYYVVIAQEMFLFGRGDVKKVGSVNVIPA